MPTFHGQAFVTPVGTQVSFVGKDSDKQEPAWSFIKYLIENGAKDLYEAGDRIPARLSDQELEEIRENAYAKAFIVQINQGEPMLPYPRWVSYGAFMSIISVPCGQVSRLQRKRRKIWWRNWKKLLN